MIYKLWDKSHFRHCKKCDALYVPRQLNEEEHRSYGPIEEVEKCEDCCPVCPNCGKLIDRVKGTRKAEFEAALNKSGELKLDENPGENDIMEIRCAECGGKLDMEKYVKEVVQA